MFSMKELKHQGERSLLGNMCHDSAKMAIHGTNTENVLTAGAVSFSIAGKMYSKAAATEIDLSDLSLLDEDGDSATASALAAGYTRVTLLALNSSGTVYLIEGTDVANGGSAYCPECPDGYAPYCAVKVVNGTAADFTLGTTTLDTTGITDTYVNLQVVPAATI